MDGFATLLDRISDDRGMFFLSACNEARLPRWLYARYWWRHGMVLRTRISAIGYALTRFVSRAPPIRILP
jgi:hypothetical protein